MRVQWSMSKWWLTGLICMMLIPVWAGCAKQAPGIRFHGAHIAIGQQQRISRDKRGSVPGIYGII